MKCTFPLALTFLTICPWPRLPLARPQELARSMFWFPWVGFLLGLVYWLAFLGLKICPAPAASAVLLAFTVIATRGLHLDGLADTVDGLGGGRDAEERLQIMKDSRLGTFGAVALILVLVLKFSFFLALAENGSSAGLILFPIIGRWGMVLLAGLSPYARPEGGLGQAMTEGVSHRVAAGATVSAVFMALLVFRLQGLVILALAGLAVLLLSRYFQKKLGGITGDTLGAANELLEVLVLGGTVFFQI
jgi:adenosylcobinamide-GDP ribazoletransferase